MSGPAARVEIPATPGPSFTSKHTENFPHLLDGLGISLAVSTYQAGKLIFLRAEGETLNTHFRNFSSPMGIAYDPARERLALGARHEVWEFRNHRRVAPGIEPHGRCDAAFLPVQRHVSGDIRIHEIAWIGEEVWAVNTRFSCLATFDRTGSFNPVWRPPFITKLTPDDRCHLNGMAVTDGKVRWLTCLGATDEAGGWRQNKARGGCLLAYPSGEVVASGLSMPHSPREYAGHLWLLESGTGALTRVDPKTGKVETFVKLPGFARGIDFFGPYAFIGLSQVRESAVFSGIPLVAEIKQRVCGVWVIDLRSATTAAFLEFDGIVQEIFAVQVLTGKKFPDLICEPGELLDSSFLLSDATIQDMS